MIYGTSLEVLQMEDEAQQTINRIKNSIKEMNPSKQEVHLDLIAQLLEGSKSLVDIKLPKGAKTTCIRPSAASKKRIKTKLEPRKPSQLEKILPKHVASEKNDPTKKMMVQTTQNFYPVQSTRKIPALLESPQYLTHFPPMIHQNPQKSQGEIIILLESRLP
ncbi:hypothetical protein VP01_6767g1 [Puccinia sorghi]|uniref:Uncharacterized protein n=1 Tax=Puccinia sorghi TaxID=27349 RepID=A0A0L6UGT1_9BASI|nr:hypothetical protein VP01_6767g1 [Puccinia sorghi]